MLLSNSPRRSRMLLQQTRLLRVEAEIMASPDLRRRSYLLLLRILLLSWLPLWASDRHPAGTAAAATLEYNICDSSAGNYTANSTFQANLGRLVSSLTSEAPATGYSNGTAGRPPDQVFGLALCRGDSTPDQCQSCLAGAMQDIARVCPNSRGAILWYENEKCLLRYSSQNFFGASAGTYLYMWSPAKDVPDPSAFNGLLAGLLGDLTASARSSPRMFATGERLNNTTFQIIYALVQCTRDLEPDSCGHCLTLEISDIPKCCNGKEGGRVIGGSCFLRYEVFPFYNAAAATGPPPPATSSPPAPGGSPPAPGQTDGTSGAAAGSGGKKDSTLEIALAIAIPLIAVAAITIIFFICRKKKNWPREIIDDREDPELQPVLESLLFDLETLKLATDNFSESNKLGRGGFGVVYKGVLPSGIQIAAKRLVWESGQGLGELRNEVVLVAKLQHRNLVRLLGCCLEDGEALLVYEYMENKSLDLHLFDPTKSKELDWERRMKIIEGIARGLLYLHEDSRLRIIHRDLKASNILLDADMNPKISDFGLARLFDGEQTQGNTSKVAGTFGYMAPEYIMEGQISTKSDVYSFGILVLEIVTGRKCISYRDSSVVDLISYAWQHWNGGTALQALDPSIISGGCCPEQAVLRCIHIALQCAQRDPRRRPSMSSVVLMFSSPSVSLPAAVSPPEYFFTYQHELGSSNMINCGRTISGRASSNAVASDTTTLEPR